MYIKMEPDTEWNTWNVHGIEIKRTMNRNKKCTETNQHWVKEETRFDLVSETLVSCRS